VARLLALLSCGLVVCISDVQAQGHPPTPNAGHLWFARESPCKPNIYVEATTFTPTAQSPESGPFTYTITVNNMEMPMGLSRSHVPVRLKWPMRESIRRHFSRPRDLRER